MTNRQIYVIGESYVDVIASDFDLYEILISVLLYLSFRLISEA